MIVVFVCLLADAVLGTCGAQSSCVSCVNENTNCFWCPSMGACDRDGKVCNGEKTRSCASPPPPPCGPPVNVCGTSTGCFVLVTRAKCVALRCVCVCACWFSSLIYVFFFSDRCRCFACSCASMSTTTPCEDASCRNCRYDYGQVTVLYKCIRAESSACVSL